VFFLALHSQSEARGAIPEFSGSGQSLQVFLPQRGTKFLCQINYHFAFSQNLFLGFHRMAVRFVAKFFSWFSYAAQFVRVTENAVGKKRRRSPTRKFFPVFAAGWAGVVAHGHARTCGYDALPRE
jgi:hypothetical protein